MTEKQRQTWPNWRQKGQDPNNKEVVTEGLRGLVSGVRTRHLKPWTRGRGWGTDGWVTVWWRRHNKREITLLSRPHHPHALRYSSSNYLKKDILSPFGPFSYSGGPAGKFYLSDQTGLRNTGALSLSLSSEEFLFRNKYKRHDSDYKRKREWQKGSIVGVGQLISLPHGPWKTKRCCSGW